ncbi:HAD family hydrolase [Anianabacter salinae]|uniref:HAD family hydrolase n=1 Tax=Anianabacter salinae TaxID=2851023 RepID=UPI00225E68AB|nr:HAD-IA family hydrolase [Anianabacter salinae]MBV0911408.1 HAD-IA family hydrolase [Anianabacter salinae]
MAIKALLIGSIGVLCETSNMQRHAYNAAFKETGLDWTWEAKAFTRLVQAHPDSVARIEAHARTTGQRIDASAVAERKSRIFRQMLARAPVRLRPGLADSLIAARKLGLRLAFTSSEDIAEIEALLDATTPRVAMADFAYVGHSDTAQAQKPAPDVYLAALARLGLGASEVLAVEDTPDGAQGAIAAGVACVGFPNIAQIGQTFPCPTVDVLSPSRIGLVAEDGFPLSA